MIKAVLFDYDGTLMDTESVIIASYMELFRRYRRPEDFTPELQVEVLGPSLDVEMKKFFPEKDVEQLKAEYRDYQNEHIRELIKPFPGCIDLLKALQERGIRCGLVSTRRTDSMELHLEMFGMTDYFQTIIGTDKVANNKPDPEGIFKAMDELGVVREETMYVGDSASDIMAGHQAGVLTAGIITNENKRQAVEMAGPDYMLKELISLVSVIDML